MADKTMGFDGCRVFTDALYLAIEDKIALREDKEGFEYTQNCIGQGYIRFYNGFKIDYEIDDVWVRFDMGVDDSRWAEGFVDIYLVTTEDNQLVKSLKINPALESQFKSVVDWIMYELNEEIHKRIKANNA